MLSRRLALRAISCRPIVSSHSLPSILATRLIATSSSRSRPAAQLAEVEDESPDHYPHQAFVQAQSGPSFSPPTHRPIVHLPPPLPTDARNDCDPLYPSTGVIDAISMISICLRRPEHIPRAYQIFQQLLGDSEGGFKRIPEADVWGKVIQGIASLAKPKHGDPDAPVRWRRRAAGLVADWEMIHRSKGQNKVAGGSKDGLRIYQGWFAGLVSSESSLEPLQPYFENRSITVDQMLRTIREMDMPLAYESLLKMSQGLPELDFIGEDVKMHQGIERTRQEIMARDVVPEVMPVLEKHGKNILRRGDDVPEVEHASGVRFAVSNLRQTLSKLSESALPRERQIALEKASYDAAQAEMTHAFDTMTKQKGSSASQDPNVLQRQRLQSWMYEWKGALRNRLEEDIGGIRDALEASVNKVKVAPMSSSSPTAVGLKDHSLALYLTLLPVDKLALITVIELMRQSGGHGVVDGMKALRAMLAVGKAVETEYRAETIRNVAGADSPQWLRALDPQTQKPTPALVGKVWRKLGKQLDATADEDNKAQSSAQGARGLNKAVEDDLRAVWTPAWSQMAHLGIGSFLVTRLLEEAQVNRTGRDPETGEEVSEMQPAFSHGYDYVRGRKLGVIRLNPAVAKRLANDSISSMIHPKHLPMLVEPRPWRKADDGGYLIHSVPAMRYKDSSEQKIYLQSAAEQGHLEPVFHGLDVLSSTPWAINRKVFDVILEAWNSGRAIADIPPAETESSYDLPDRSTTGDPNERAIYVAKAKMALAQQRKDHAERCKFNYNIEIARSYLHETFYLPHSMDFRGRAYPIPPHLSPVGDDLCRGLLTFAIKRPLGKTGLKWLQIHLANLYGFDKASFEERARFSQDHEADIFDSADNPLNGKRWWLQAEDPWQCLATCFELTNALRSPNPELYESNLPVHQDGTCNGMQHYAALGGDVRGARAVNLENGDRPADIYTGVADVVNRVIQQDKAAGHEIAQFIPSPLGRKVVKQTVMTTVYGVTFIGARDQIARQLEARGDIPAERIFEVSGYVAKTVLSCIGDLFTGATDIMDWLTTSARLVARSIPPSRVEEAVQNLKNNRGAATKKTRMEKELMTSVVWTTPLGLPVVQPYRKAAKKQVMTALQSVYIADPNAPSEVSPQKQATAFPPNFIHSLDATHMLLTAVKCKQKGITFSSVHDSYWTHAATVEPMSEMIRDMFIKLHSGDVIGELRDEFLDRYGENRIPVKNARSISASATKRKLKDAERREQMASLLSGENGDESAAEGVVAGATGESVENPSPECQAESLESALAAQGQVEEGESGSAIHEEDDGDGGEDGGDDDAPARRPKGGSNIELTNADLEALRRKRAAAAGQEAAEAEVPEEVIERQRFVKFKDVLPPCPPRGAFDVSRIKDSAYFFS